MSSRSNEQHLRRLIRDYVSFYHQDRIHDSLDKDSPRRHPVEQKPAGETRVTSIPRLVNRIIATRGARRA
jgi:hypothetical protein